jgi:polysaccharide deacetylase 2 family uncharacterized protein YibQ
MKLSQPPTGKSETAYSARLFAAFALVALFSSLGLDYLASRKGEKSYVFSFLAPEKEAPEIPLSLTQTVLPFLKESGLPAGAIQGGQEESAAPQVRVSLSRDVYTKLEPQLENLLKEKGIPFEKKEDQERTSYSWLLRRGKSESLTLLFACPKPLPPKKEEALRLPPENVVAIIIDDMGNSLEALQEIRALKRPVTISILPLSTYAVETAQIAHENGLEVMLHLPGESLNHQEGNDSAGGIIRSGMDEKEIRTLVEDSLGRVPYVEGVNNHMGSKITQDEPVMRTILEFLRAKKLYFLDSRTTRDSIAYDLAKKMGLRSAFRNVFLDSTVSLNFTRQKMTELCRLSQRTGKAIGIGHPFPETLRALKENIGLLEKYRVRPVFVSQVVEDPSAE